MKKFNRLIAVVSLLLGCVSVCLLIKNIANIAGLVLFAMLSVYFFYESYQLWNNFPKVGKEAAYPSLEDDE